MSNSVAQMSRNDRTGLNERQFPSHFDKLASPDGLGVYYYLHKNRVMSLCYDP